MRSGSKRCRLYRKRSRWSLTSRSPVSRFHSCSCSNHCVGNGRLSKDTMDVVSGTKHPHHSPAPDRYTKPHCRCGVSDNGGSVRLETEPDLVQENGQSLWSNRSRPICILPDCPVPSLFQLAARFLCSSNRCIFAGLVSDTGICRSSVELDRASPVTGSGATGLYHSGGTSLEDTTLVPTISRYAEGIPLSAQTPSDNAESRLRESSPQLVVWPISGRDTESMSFRRKLPTFCSNPGELRQINLTTHSSGSGIAGVRFRSLFRSCEGGSQFSGNPP